MSTLCAGADIRREFHEDVVRELQFLGVGVSPGNLSSLPAYALWNASKIILNNGYISLKDFAKFFSDSHVKYTLTNSSIFLERNDLERIYFQSRIVEDYMRFTFGLPPESGNPICTTYD